MSNNLAKKALSALRLKAEERFKTENKSYKKTNLHEIDRELKLHEIELNMQNEDHLETQSKLIAALREFEELFEFSPIGYFILDKDGLILKANETGCNQLGISKSNLIHKHFSLCIENQEEQDDFLRHRNLVIETGELLKMICKLKRKDGTIFSALIKSTSITDKQNKFKHLLSTITDITEIKENEQIIQLALKKSEELNKMKSRFIAMASHEFRTPLTIVLSSAILAEQNAILCKEEKIKKHLNRIRSSIKDLTNLLDEFLAIEMLETGMIKIIRKKLNLPEFCLDIIDNVAIFMKKDQYIVYKHTGDEYIISDIKIIQNILIAILSNACKFSAEKKAINFSTEVNNNKITILVKDYGIGIPKNEQKNIFTRFFRAHNAINIKGAGLELHIVKQYLELLNGTINFTSQLNKGSTFCIQFPVNPSK